MIYTGETVHIKLVLYFLFEFRGSEPFKGCQDKLPGYFPKVIVVYNHTIPANLILLFLMIKLKSLKIKL